MLEHRVAAVAEVAQMEHSSGRRYFLAPAGHHDLLVQLRTVAELHDVVVAEM